MNFTGVADPRCILCIMEYSLARKLCSNVPLYVVLLKLMPETLCDVLFEVEINTLTNYF